MSNTTSFGYLIPTARKVSPLRQRMIEDMTVRNFAPNTQQSYLGQVGLFARYFGSKSPEQLGPEEIRNYQIYLAQERKVSVGTRIVAVSALRFLYAVTLKRDWTVPSLVLVPVSARIEGLYNPTGRTIVKSSSRCKGVVVLLVSVVAFGVQPTLADEIFYTARNDGGSTVGGIAPGQGAIQHLTTPSTLVTIVGTSIQPDSLVLDGNLIVYTLNGNGVNQAQLGVFDTGALTNTVFNLPGNGGAFPPGAQPRDLGVNVFADPTGNTVTYGDFNTGIIYNVNLTTHVATPFITGLGPNGVQGVVFDNLGDLYAVTGNGTQVQEFSPLGILLHTSATLSGLDGITFEASTSNLYVSDKANMGFQKFSPDLSTHTLLGTGTGLVIPDGIEVGVGTLAGDIFIADFGNQKIVKETTGGSFVASFNAPLIDDLAPFGNPVPRVPEPGTFALICSALLILGAGRSFMKHRS